MSVQLAGTDVVRWLCGKQGNRTVPRRIELCVMDVTAMARTFSPFSRQCRLRYARRQCVSV